MPLSSPHTLSILVDNKTGVLARIVGLFSARGYDIGSPDRRRRAGRTAR